MALALLNSPAKTQMKPFRFSLQSLPEFRVETQETIRERFTRTLRACEQAAAQLQAASTELTSSWTTLCNNMAGGVMGDQMLRARAWCLVLEIRVKERAAALEQARHAVDQVWNELLVVTRARETLERFSEKRPRTSENQARQLDEKILDAVAIQLAHSPVLLSSPANPS